MRVKHRNAAAAIATALGVAVMAVPSARATPDPCAASEVAKTVGWVAASTGTYLVGHPETNQTLTTIAQQPADPQSLGSLKTYFDANPQVGKDMLTIQQPLLSLSTQCKLPIIPQVLGMLQTGQSPGTPPGGFPGGFRPPRRSALLGP
ncbi:MAG: heme-binding protein [Mycobacterium sp.]|nr:heme-binding protein [Mycobacterium sp.]